MSATDVQKYDPVVIKASAGSGKTHAISNRYISLLLAGEKPEKILATTFTRKAAGEIRARVIKRLAEAALSEEKLNELKTGLELSKLTKKDVLVVLKRLSLNLHRLNISTLDSFFIKIAKSFCHELGLTPFFAVIEESERHEVVNSSILLLCNSIGESEFSLLLSKLSRKDSGRRVHDLLLEEMPALKELVLRSNSDAWKWLQPDREIALENIKDLVIELRTVPPETNKDGTPNKNWVTALEDLCRLTQEENWKILINKGLLKAFLEKTNKYYSKSFSSKLTELLGKVADLARTQYIIQLDERLQAAYGLGQEYSRQHSSLSLRSQQITFSDVKNLLREASFIGALEEIYFRIDTQISHLLLDEFQDTSDSEWKVIEPIVDEILSKAESEQSFFCVGDTKQAIYGWRGGVAEIFDTLTNRWEHLKQESLKTSYRSSPEVISFVNLLFRTISNLNILTPYFDTVKVWQDNFLEHSTTKNHLKGHVKFFNVPLLDEEDVFTPVISFIEDLLSKEIYSEISVLVRSHKSIAKIVRGLNDRGIAASEEGGNPVNHSIAVTSILSLLTLLDHPSDTVALYQVIYSPIGKALGLSFHSDDNQRNSLLLKVRREILEQGLGLVLNKWVNEIKNDYPLSDHSYLHKLVELGFEYEGKLGLRFRDYIQFVSSKKAENTNGAPIKVMTIHQSKGLEFDCVVLPDLDFRIIDHTKTPSFIPYKEEPLGEIVRVAPRTPQGVRKLIPQLDEIQSSYDNDVLKESLSLLYVAITRAKRGLYMFSESTTTKSGSIPLSYSSILKEAFNVESSSEDVTSFEIGQEPNKNDKGETLKSRSGQEITPPVVIPVLKKGEQSRGAQVVLPSQLSGNGKVSISSIFSSTSQAAKNRGSLLHNIFEELEWLSPEEEFNLSNIKNSMMSNLEEQAMAEIMSTIREAFAHPKILEIFTQANYGENPKLYREQRFAYLHDGKIINGAMDRLTISNLKGKLYAEVVDFKSGSKSSDGSDAKAEYYKPQMDCYKEAVHQLFNIPIENITTKLLFIDSKEIIEL